MRLNSLATEKKKNEKKNEKMKCIYGIFKNTVKNKMKLFFYFLDLSNWKIDFFSCFTCYLGKKCTLFFFLLFVFTKSFFYF